MKSASISITLLIITVGITVAQNFSSQLFYDNHDTYKETIIDNKRFSYADMQGIISKHVNKNNFRVRSIGKTLEGRDIKLISFGNGSIDILAWSQMHGDESTATMALLDILNFFDSNDSFDNLRKKLLDKVTIHLIPMLNPDGVERFQRRNALDIDLNRDALRLQFPESKALKAVRDSINPEFGFNLHDQSTRYTSGKTYKAATLSFLAPAYNYQKDINDVRANTMKVIVNLFDELSRFIPGHIARYDDEFEPRAFGDNMVKWGTSSVLIESGGWKDNFEKQFIRKLNFVALLTAFESIALGYYQTAHIDKYNAIPENEKNLFDVLFRNLTIEFDGKNYIIDIGINHNEKSTDNDRNDYYFGLIEDIGDLSTFFGYDEYDCTGMNVTPAKVFPDTIKDLESARNLDFVDLYKNSFTSVRVKNIDSKERFTKLPINIISENKEYNSSIGVGKFADFVIYDNGAVRFVIINGYAYDLRSDKSSIINGIIFE